MAADMPSGKALDILEGSPVEHFDVSVTGSGDAAVLSGADVVIVTAGSARKPGMTRDDLLNVNARIVGSVAENIKTYAPDAFVIVVTNPLDVMAWLVRKTTGFDRRQVVGMAGALDSARFRTFIAMELDVSVKDVHARVLGGHGDSMVPLVRCASVSGVPLSDLMDTDAIDRLVERTRKAGGEIVKLLGDGSAYVSPAASAVMMTEAYLRDQKRVMGASAYLEGEYGIEDIYLGVPVKLSGRGLEEIIEIGLSPEEQAMLAASAEEVKAQIDLLR
jgi:malate dehydrogenase